MRSSAAMGFVARSLRLREGAVFAAYAAILLALMALFRPMFMSLVPAASYRAPVIVWAMLRSDFLNIQRAFQGKPLGTPSLLFLVVPTLVLLVLRRRLRWTDFDSGKSLRAFVVTIVAMLAWSGATYDYNSYLDQGHFVDRALLVILAIVSYFTPLAVPFAVRWAIVMIKEAYIPITLDDFDFRPVPEVIIVFSCFLWAGLLRGFKTKHFLFAGIACWASYYYAAGVAKLRIGPEWWTWTLEDHVSNVSAGAHVRGWLSWISDDAYMAFYAVAGRADLLSTGYTMVLELGALCLFFVRPRLTRLMFLGCCTLHLGIFAMTGLCFWKWMFANIAFFIYLGRGGAKPLREMLRPAVLVFVFGAVTVFFSRGRDYFYPQTGVSWYDSPMVENYILYAIGKSGKRYFIDTRTLAPMDMHWSQGRLCYATQERSVTGIFGVTGSYNSKNALEKLDKPADVMKLIARGRKCDDPKQRAKFDDFFKRYFTTLNKKGLQHPWLRWIGRPRHVWTFPTAPDRYEVQEPVTRVELWREVTVHHGGKIHKLETKHTHTVEIP